MPEGWFDVQCTYGGERKQLNLGDSIEICVFLSTIPPLKLTYRLIVDEYTSLTLANSMKKAVAEIQKEQDANLAERPVYAWLSF